MYPSSSSDRGLELSVARNDHTGAWRRREDRERGQAMVEFALILFPLLILVAGIIQFGIALNFWLDSNRIANQGARWAVVNSWPGCTRTQAADSCTATPACGTAPTNTSLANYLKCEAISQGLQNSLDPVQICYPDDGDPNTALGAVGTPVRVRLESDFEWVPLIGGAVGSPTLKLRGQATMRLEQDQTNSNPAAAPRHLTGVGVCPP